MDLNATLAQINTLNVDERIWLIRAIWDGIPDTERDEIEDDFGLTDEQKADLDRRIAEEEANPGIGVPWREAMARIKGRQ